MRVFDTLRNSPYPRARQNTSIRQPPQVAKFVSDALGAAHATVGATNALAQAVAEIEAELAWKTATTDETIRPGCSNALLVGPHPRALEERADVFVGLTLVEPNRIYPDHRHSPEELYFVLGTGEWRQDECDWTTHAPGSVVHTPPGAIHAMRANASPLLALWFLSPIE